MKREHVETILWIVMIVILVFLTNRIEDRGQLVSCNECSVHLENKRAGGEYFEFGEYQIKALFSELVTEGTCAIKWDPVQGYYVSHNAP